MPTVRFASPNSKDFSESAGFITGTLQLSAATTSAVTVTVKGASFNSADLDISNQTITIAAGQTTATFKAAIVDDSVIEQAEVFDFEITSATNADIDNSTSFNSHLLGYILDNDAPPNLPTLRFASPNSKDFSEGGGFITGTLQLSTPSTSAVTVTVKGASFNSADLDISTQTITIAAGQTTAAFKAAIIDDSIVEQAEVFDFEITAATNANIDYSTSFNSHLLGYVLDNDAPANLPTIRFASPNSKDFSEGAGFVTGTLQLSAPSTSAVAVTVKGASFNSADLDISTQTITIAAGQTTAAFKAAITEDSIVEQAEVFDFEITAATNANVDFSTSFNSHLLGYILDNDTASSSAMLSISGPASKAEGNAGTTNFDFTVTRSGSTSAPASVSYSISGAGASPSDFIGGAYPSGSLSLAAGETTKTLSISVLGDTTFETDEGFTVILSNPSGATLGTSTATATILNDDLVTLQPASLTVIGPNPTAEGNSGSTAFIFTVARNGDASGASSATYTVTGIGSTASDFSGGVFPSGTVNFTAGQVSREISIPVAGDTTVEPDEYFTLTLSNPVGATLLVDNATATIQNDDSPATKAVMVSAPSSVREGDNKSFDVSLIFKSVSQIDTTVSLSVGGGTATDGADMNIGSLVSKLQTVQSPTGDYTYRLGTFTIVDDALVEGDETIQLLVSAPGYTFSNGQSTTTVSIALLDNDSTSTPTTPTVQQATATLNTAFDNILRAAPGSADVGFVAGLAGQVAAGALNKDQALAKILDKADATTSVATMAYEFFTGKIPSAGGMDYLVSPAGPNPNNLNSPYYQDFSIENRNINFAVNLGKSGEGAAKFAAEYGVLDLTAATTKAYQTIFGTAPTLEKVRALLDPSFNLGGLTLTRAEYFAYYGQDGASGIGTKAAMVGWLLAEAEKANIGTYAKSNAAFLMDLADGANYAVDIVGVYGKPEFAI